MGIETLAIASMAAGAAGGIIGGIGARKQADAQAQSANYQAAVARNNQIIAERYGEYAISKGRGQAELSQYRTAQAVGTAKATQAASGVDVNSGTPVAVRQSIKDIGELDAATIVNNSLNEAYGYKVKAAGFGAESQLSTMKAKFAEDAGDYAVASSLLGGATSVSDKWAGYKLKGAF